MKHSKEIDSEDWTWIDSTNNDLITHSERKLYSKIISAKVMIFPNYYLHQSPGTSDALLCPHTCPDRSDPGIFDFTLRYEGDDSEFENAFSHKFQYSYGHKRNESSTEKTCTFSLDLVVDGKLVNVTKSVPRGESVCVWVKGVCKMYQPYQVDHCNQEKQLGNIFACFHFGGGIVTQSHCTMKQGAVDLTILEKYGDIVNPCFKFEVL